MNFKDLFFPKREAAKGILGKTTRALGTVFFPGVRAIGQSTKTAYDSTRQDLGQLRVEPDQYRKELFSDAMARHARTPADVENMAKQFRFVGRIWASGAILSLVAAIGLAITGAGYVPAALLSAAPCAVMAFKMLVRAEQCRRREFFEVGGFVPQFLRELNPINWGKP